MVGTSWVVFVAMLSFIAVTLIQDSTVYPLVAIAISTAFTIYLAQWGGQIRVASHLLVANVSFVIAFYNYIEGGIYAPSLVLSVAPGVLAMIVLGGTSGLLWFGVSVLLNLLAIFSSSLIGFESRLGQSDQMIGVAANIIFGSLALAILLRRLDHYNKELHNQLQQQNEEFEQLTDSLMGAIKDKQALVTVVCHDLATPVTTLQTNLELFRAIVDFDNLGLKPAECVKRLESATGSIHEIVSFTRSMMSAEFGKLEVSLTRVYLPEVIDQLQKLYKDRLCYKDLTVEVENSYGDVWVLAEERSLTYSVIGNILSNAIKFSPKGGNIHFNIRVEESKAGENSDRVYLELEDYGPGMDRSILSTLLSWDNVVSRKGSFGEEGTGFGMPACLSWMKSYKGQILVTTRHFTDSPVAGPHEKIGEQELLVDSSDAKVFYTEVKNRKESGSSFVLCFLAANT